MKKKHKKPKVVIIGAGFGGLNAAMALRNAPVDILVIDKTNHHLFQPLLYQVASAALFSGNIASPIREVLCHQENAHVIMATIETIDTTAKQVIAQNGECFAYDYLIIATGSRHAYFAHPEWEEFAPGLKTLQDAMTIRERVLTTLEMAERCDNLITATNLMRFVIIGGGPTGVEMSGAIAEITRKTMFKNFRKIKPEHSEIFLFEGNDNILQAYPEKLSISAERALEKMGVKVKTNARVTNIHAHGVDIGEESLATTNIIWAAGNQASPILKTLNTLLDPQGKAMVEKDLSLPNHPEIFVIGDAAHNITEEGLLLPGIAPVAIQQGKYVAQLIKNELKTIKRTPFKYKDKGMMATIGKAQAVVSIGKLQMAGFFAWVTWSIIHILYLVSFRNRLSVMLQWSFWYITSSRNERLISRPIEDSHFLFRPKKQ